MWAEVPLDSMRCCHSMMPLTHLGLGDGLASFQGQVDRLLDLPSRELVVQACPVTSLYLRETSFLLLLPPQPLHGVTRREWQVEGVRRRCLDLTGAHEQTQLLGMEMI